MTADDMRTGGPLSTRCTTCGAPLAHDQRYCLECGTRRGGLPQAIAERIQAMLARGDVEALGTAAAVASTPSTGRWRSMPSPRSAAVAIMGMLAFGVVVGSVASTNAESAATGPLVMVVAPQGTTPVPPAAASAPAPPVPPAVPAASPASPAGASAPSTPSSPSSAVGSSSSSSSSSGAGTGGSSTPPTLPPVKHVFVIMLSGERYDQTFGAPASDPYLAKTLRKQGELLPNYYAVAQGALANEIAVISGQGPTEQTELNCPRFTDVLPGIAGTEGQVVGSGCVYPSTTLTLANQLAAAGKTWKAYVEGIGSGPRGQPTTCRHPALGSADPGQAASLIDPYVTWSNPFVYFHSLAKKACAKDDVALGRLAADLRTVKTTPAFSYIAPSPCDDGNPQPCVPGARSGLAAADRFLRGVVPEILASPAYKADGLIAITFDEAPQSGPYADSSSCCANPTQYPNLPTPATPTTTAPTTTTTPAPTPATVTGPPAPAVPYAIAPPATTPTPTTPTTTTPTTTTPTVPIPASEQTGQTTPTGGGGEVGLLLISRYVKANSTDTLAYFNHFSFLSSVEQLFGLTRLGYAHDVALPAFGKPQYNAYKP